MSSPRSRSFILSLLFLCAAQLFAQNPATTIAVDANASRHAISPLIYGFAFGAQSDLSATNFTMNRDGGNETSTYNWQINAANHDSDYYFESILDTPQLPGSDGDTFITQTRAANVGAQALLTIPMMNYLAKLGTNGATLWSFSIAKYGAQTGHDPYQSDAGNGISSATNKQITGNNPLDAYTPNSVATQQGWIQHLIGAWGLEASGGLKYYIMDNEPSLWNSTHVDIHPACLSYSEYYNDFIAYAGALRALDPNAVIVGPEEWSWWAMFLSGCDQLNGTSGAGSDYNTHNKTYYYPWLLQQLYAYRQSTGKQLINVLSMHYYPQELSNSDDDSLSGQLTRNQSTRVLWDPTYVDPSWFNQVGINNGIVNLIPTMQNWVSQYYPGLQTAITEYNWGDETHLNGATTQADVLGLFGRESLDIATRWTVPVNPSPTYLAMEIYRNYDGNLSTFGDTSVSATVVNPDNLSSFAAVRSSDGALTVMAINKQQGSTPVTISLANFTSSGTAHAYQISSATQTSITHLANVSIGNNTITTTLPSQSITLFVIPAGSVTTAVTVQTVPTGLHFSVDGGAAQAAPQTLNLTQGSHAIAVVTTQAGTTGMQYAFTAWSDSGAASHSITVGSTAATYTASFETQYQLTISASPAGQGTFTPASGAFYNAGLAVPINATANSGYEFLDWAGAAASANTASTSVTMSAPQTVTANFIAGHPPFFTGENFLGNGIYYLAFPNNNLFGYYGYLSGGWIYHVDLGYEYVSPGTGSQAYIWDLTTGHWWYTDSNTFPYLYDFNLKVWIYYFPNTSSAGHYTTSPRYFANLTTGAIFTM